MVAGAADMIARRGVSAASVREVVRNTSTPRGSIAHHFPGGRQQLIEEAISHAGQFVAQTMERLMIEQGARKGMKRFIAGWRARLQESHYEAGCPILAACIEGPVSGLSGDSAGTNLGQADQGRLLDLADSIFLDWQRIFADALRREGVAPARSRRLAVLVVAAIEGTIALCRSGRTTKPLDDIGAELDALIADALADVSS